jgi:hypothetical protein
MLYSTGFATSHTYNCACVNLTMKLDLHCSTDDADIFQEDWNW